MSLRVNNTGAPHIEDVLEKYSTQADLIRLALGSSYWRPPIETIQLLQTFLLDSDTHRYGAILGLSSLREKLAMRLTHRGVDMTDKEIAVTCGANQAFMNVALALCDDGDDAVMIAPYYFSHLSALQLAGAKVSFSTFQPDTLKPNWVEFQSLLEQTRPKLVICTSPNNPSGVVWSTSELEILIRLCEQYGAWLVLDETYAEFTYGGESYTIPCGTKYGYDKIIHVFSLSKSFGIPGWRVGYLMYPASLNLEMRKIQDTIPTHCPVISQLLAVQLLEHDDDYCAQHGVSWVTSQVRSLDSVRSLVWDAVAPLGTVRTSGAFYFLVPVPAHVTEEEAVHTLATEFGVLLMLGWPFGAAGYLRLSYGSLPPSETSSAANRLKAGVSHLLSLSRSRTIPSQLTTH